MSLRCTVQIRIDGISESESASVIKALEPDNVDVPDGMSIAMRHNHHHHHHSNTDSQEKKSDVLEIEVVGIDNNDDDDDDDNSTQEKGRTSSNSIIGSMVGTIDEMLGHVQVAQRVLQ